MRKTNLFLVFFIFLTLTLNALCIGPEMPPLPFENEYPHANMTVVRGVVEIEDHNIPFIHSGNVVMLELYGFSQFSFVSFIQKEVGGPIERMLDNNSVLRTTRQNNFIFLEALPVTEPTMISFGFGGPEFANRFAPSLIWQGKVVASGLIIMPVPVPLYKTEEPRKSTETCSKGQVSVDGKCVTPPPIVASIEVGRWIEYLASVTRGNYGTVTFNPNEWEVGQVLFSEGNEKVAEGCSLTFSGVWDKGIYKCNGYVFVPDPQKDGVLVVAQLKPKVKGYLKILFTIYGPGWKQEVESVYEAIPALAMAPGTTKKEKGPSPEGKSLFKWGGVKRE